VSETAVESLVRFSRLASEARSSAEILPLLAAGATSALGASAACVLRVANGGELELVASENLPEELAAWRGEADEIGHDLGQVLLAASGGKFSGAHAVPLVSGGSLYGVLVIFTDQKSDFGPAQRALALAYADLAAVALHKAADYAELARSYFELKQSRETLAQSEKLRALGQMAAGIAHDMKNILNPLSLQLQLVKIRVAKNPGAVDEVLAQMQDSIKTGTALLEQLRDFSRQERERPAELVDLNAVAAGAADIVRPQFRMNAKLSLCLELGEPPPIYTHAAELTAVLVNLMLNAFEATVDGTITLATGEERGGAWISVADTGPGMVPDVAALVFQPFFTTKGSRGTGLGLAMAYAFVLRMGGRIDLDTAPGQGARFRIWLPRSAVSFTPPPGSVR
jgi:signal transduction histidine kinase